MKRIFRMSSAASIIAVTAACSSSVTLTNDPAATLGSPQTTIVDSDPSTSVQPTESSTPTNDTAESSDDVSPKLLSPPTTAPDASATSTTTTVEPVDPVEPESSPELIAAATSCISTCGFTSVRLNQRTVWSSSRNSHRPQTVGPARMRKTSGYPKQQCSTWLMANGCAPTTSATKTP